MTTVPALSALITPPFSGSTQRTMGSRIYESWVSVMDFGAVGDGSHDDTSNIQAAMDYAFGWNGAHIGNPFANKTLFFPPGDYKTTATLNIKYVDGIQMIGSGRHTTRIHNVTSGSTVLSSNGMAYFLLQGISFQGTGTTGIVWDYDWDNNVQSAQAGTTIDCNFGVGSMGIRVGFTEFQTSELVFLHCYFDVLATGVQVQNFNALQMTFLAGQFQTCSNYGIRVTSGSAPNIVGTAFQNGSSNIADISIEATAGDCYCISGCRSESANFAQIYSGTRASLIGISHLGATGTFLGTNDVTKVCIDSCYSANGKINANNSTNQLSIRCSEFGRSDWISYAGTFTNTDIEIEATAYNTNGTDAYIRKQRITGPTEDSSRADQTVGNYMVSGEAQTYTIASGVITPAVSHMRWLKIDTQGAASSDDLDTITATNFITGDELILSSVNDARNVVVKKGTGNIWLLAAGDCTLGTVNDRLTLQWNGTTWIELSRSINN